MGSAASPTGRARARARGSPGRSAYCPCRPA